MDYWLDIIDSGNMVYSTEYGEWIDMDQEDGESLENILYEYEKGAPEYEKIAKYLYENFIYNRNGYRRIK